MEIIHNNIICSNLMLLAILEHSYILSKDIAML
nr:MAG TPA: hypothetical protein [Caudoviricetes sp.]